MMRKDKLSYEEFERLAEKAIAALPKEFQSYLENVVIVIEDESPDDTDIVGLYEGVPLVERSTDDTTLPDRITLYKKAIERTCLTRAEMETEVRLTVLHEIGHFFGLDEKQLEHLEFKNNKTRRNS